MELQVIAKQEEIPAYDKQAIKLRIFAFMTLPMTNMKEKQLQKL